MASSSGSLGQRAREMTQRAVDSKIDRLVQRVIEPAVFEAAAEGHNFCNLILNERDYQWLVTASGDGSLFFKVAEGNGLTVHSFQRDELPSSSGRVFSIVLSWSEEGPSDQEAVPRPVPTPQTKQERPPPLPRKPPKLEPRPAAVQPVQHAPVAEQEASPAVRPFIGSYVQYPATIHSVCKAGDINTLGQLLQFEEEINGPDSFGYTALHHAVSNGYIDHVELLVQHGANVVVGGMKHLTPLHCAAYMGRIDIVKVLGPIADVNKLDSASRTPLHWAAERGFTQVTSELLKHGARVNIEDRYGMTPLKYALFWRFQNIIKMLQERAKVEEEESDGEVEEDFGRDLRKDSEDEQEEKGDNPVLEDDKEKEREDGDDLNDLDTVE